MTNVHTDLPNGTLDYDSHFLQKADANRLLKVLSEEIQWQQDRIQLFGKEHPIPRLQCFQGVPGITYRYSNLCLDAEAWHPAIQSLREQLEALGYGSFNAVLMNLYRDGLDSMGWHSDDEPELGKNPIIASISLGEARRFLLRRKDNHTTKQELILEHGSLLLMSGELQHFWQHSVPRTQKPRQPRINLTFRQVR